MKRQSQEACEKHTFPKERQYSKGIMGVWLIYLKEQYRQNNHGIIIASTIESAQFTPFWRDNNPTFSPGFIINPQLLRLSDQIKKDTL